MTKTLLKKQFMELSRFYFTDSKTGKSRSKGKAAGIIVLLIFLLVIIIGLVGAAAMSVGSAMLEAGLDWLYFAMFSLTAILLGVLGSVFNTYHSLYMAKDNEMLLSMPIPPGKILFSRMIGVAAASLLYSSLVWLPAMAVYWILKPPSVSGVIFPVILLFALVLFVAVLTCLFGWIVAKATVKLKRKKIVAVIIALILMGAYFFISFRLSNILEYITVNTAAIGDFIRSWGYPLYQFGQAATGKVVPLIISLVIIGGVFALTYFIMSRSFLKITTTNTGTVKTVYKEKGYVRKSVGRALLAKEAKRFAGSTTYMLNSGLGIILIPMATVFLCIKSSSFMTLINELPEDGSWGSMVSVIIAVIICILCSMNCTSAPSVSMEGNGIWILQSMPVDPWDVLKAKVRLHVVINMVPAVICTAVLGIVFRESVLSIILMELAVMCFITGGGEFGLMMNLIKPNLNWNNESTAVKQSLSVLIAMLSGFVCAVIIGVAAFPAKSVMDMNVYFGIIIAVLAAVIMLLARWLKRRGTVIFSNL
ncbi:MAG: hypothetical protein HUJ76_01100 [Parasporobacterium sp.]|nr:hypothetical protein [Parasporobacterium sp.]